MTTREEIALAIFMRRLDQTGEVATEKEVEQITAMEAAIAVFQADALIYALRTPQ